MISSFRRLLLSTFVALNVLVIVAMTVSAYSYIVSPVTHRIIALSGMAFPIFVGANVAFLVVWIMVKWRRLWIPVVGFVLVFPSLRVYMPLNAEKEPPQGAIKMMSFNVQGYYGNGSEADGFEAVFRYLNQEKPDIACIQEDLFGNQRQRDRMDSLYAHNLTVENSPTNPGHCGWMGIHSRYPILGYERISFQSQGNGATAFRLLVEGDTVVVVNCHLESYHLQPNDKQRYKQMLKGEMERDTMRNESHLLASKIASTLQAHAPQAEAVARFIAKHKDKPLIVCGDFNDTPISYARYTIANGLTDCFVSTGNGLGLSYNQKGFNFRIDHLFCSSHFKPYHCHIDEKTAASDHYPLVCWLQKVDNH